MFLYSGKGLNDLGDYDKCHDADGTIYALGVVEDSPLWIGIGFCLPSSCTPEMAAALSESLSSQVNATLTISFPDENLPSSLGAGAVCTICFFALLAVLSAVGIVVEYSEIGDRMDAQGEDGSIAGQLQRRKEKWALLLLSFSFTFNLKKL